MNRRHFLRSGVAVASGLASLGIASPLGARPRGASSAGEAFTLDYAPHFGMFRHHAGDDLVAQLEFMHAEGFRSLEDNWMARRPVEEQERIARALERLGMRMGVFVAHAEFGKVTFASSDASVRERIAADMKLAVETARRVGARWCTVVPGAHDVKVEPDWQTANVVENLRRAAEVLEPAELTMVLEPLNPWRDHPGLYLTKVSQAYLLCRAVNSPSVKILDDLYHQQITEGNLTPNLDRAWSEIAYIQVGDHPGRKEPTTGEIHYGHLFRHLHAKGYTGVVGMEHGIAGSGREGERALIEAYRACDPS